LAMTALKGCPSSLVIPSLIVPAHAATNMQAAATAARRCTVISRVSQQGRRRWPRRLLRCCRDRPYPRSGDTAPLDMGKTSAADEPTRVNWRRRSPPNDVEKSHVFQTLTQCPCCCPCHSLRRRRSPTELAGCSDSTAIGTYKQVRRPQGRHSDDELQTLARRRMEDAGQHCP
jgi:hypothetical protein